MGWAPIPKPRDAWRVAPNLRDYDEARAAFSWDQAMRTELDGLPGERGLNMAHEAVDRHAAGPRADRVALRWLGRSGEVEDITFRDLARRSARFANALRRLGVGPRERIFGLAGRIPDLYVAALGTLKNRSVFCPLYAAFGPEPIRARMELGQARVLVTTASLYERKVAPLRDALPELEHVLLVDGQAPGAEDLRDLMRAEDEEFEIPPTDPEDWALLHFTSGTTGRPKGAIHVHRAVIAHHVTGKLAVEPRPGAARAG